MRELIHRGITAAAVAMLVAAGGCKREQRAIERVTVEQSPELAAVVWVADPKSSFQLVEGFYAPEGNSWRWTARKFSVVLRAPAAAAQKGATLRLKLNVPEAVASKLGPLTLRSTAGGTELAPETFPQAGDHEYLRDVPAQAFQGDSVTVTFALDKALPPGPVDQRELGVIVTMVGLEPK